jgi:predicted N-acyltransferase
MDAEGTRAHLPAVYLIEEVTLQSQNTPVTYRALVSRGLQGVSAAEWDRLLEPDDAPLLSWAYLEGLEAADCVGGRTGWQPAHLLIRRVNATARAAGPKAAAPPVSAALPADLTDGELCAAAPAYIKYDSDGEWVYDFDWAAFVEAKGYAYYPKLVLAVPFNPVGGGRLLTSPELPAADREGLRLLLLSAAKRLCHMTQMSSVHVLFPRSEEASLASLSQEGFLLRKQEQYHFLNGGPAYKSFDDFLNHMRGHRRTAIRRERRALRDSQITVRTFAGLKKGSGAGAAAGFTRQELDEMFDLYVNTSLRYTGDKPYLNRRFFHLCAERLGNKLELVLAHKNDSAGALIGGAWNLRGENRLFGRYWGQACSPEQPQGIPFLHFEVCYYHSIERCIAEGLQAFEPGHGGEHKLLRGFTPVLTYSAHYLREPWLRRLISAFLTQEEKEVQAALAAAIARCPLRTRTSPLLLSLSSRAPRSSPRS